MVKITIGTRQLSVEKEFEKMLAVAAKQPGSNNTSELFKKFRPTAVSVFSVACRNCFAAGKGLQQHSFLECKNQGNTCVLLCPKCKKGAHWIYDCPN